MSDKPHPLGKLCDINAKRDAVHVAIIPVIADQVLIPGQRIGIRQQENGHYRTSSYKSDDGHSINGGADAVVDPFLTRNVEFGDLFWAIVRPDLVGEVRHDWTLLSKPVADKPKPKMPDPLYEIPGHSCYGRC